MGHGRPDFSPTAVDVVLRPEWAAKEGKAKYLLASDTDKAWGEGVVGTYLVPAGKRLYIHGASYMVLPSASADYDHHLYAYGYIGRAAVPFTYLGGHGGGVLVLATPIIVEAGKTFYYLCSNRSGVNCNVYISAWGYEVDV